MARDVILLIDNYDSFTFNLWQALEREGARVEVRRNDAVAVEDLAELAPEALVLSPGPGRPEQAGVTLDLIERWAGRIPIFGVCLGLQAIGLALGARVVRASEPVHGKATPIRHDGSALFAGIGQPMPVGRYHSLVLERASLPPELRVTAETGDGTVMAVAHARLALLGVQFHPESVLTPDGPALLRNFLAGLPARTPAAQR